MNIFEDVIEIWENIIGMFFSVLFLPVFIILSITIPLWIVPYLIYKKRKEKQQEVLYGVTRNNFQR